MIKKTGEELRAAAAMRQKRWREKYRWKHLERVKEVYGRSNAQKHSVDGVTPEELDRYEKKVGGQVTEKREPREVQETRHVPMEEVEADEGVMREQAERMNKMRPLVGPIRQMEPEQRGGRVNEQRRVIGAAEGAGGGAGSIREPDQGNLFTGAGGGVAVGDKTVEERKVDDWLRMKAGKAQREIENMEIEL